MTSLSSAVPFDKIAAWLSDPENSALPYCGTCGGRPRVRLQRDPAGMRILVKILCHGEELDASLDDRFFLREEARTFGANLCRLINDVIRKHFGVNPAPFLKPPRSLQPTDYAFLPEYGPPFGDMLIVPTEPAAPVDEPKLKQRKKAPWNF